MFPSVISKLTSEVSALDCHPPGKMLFENLLVNGVFTRGPRVGCHISNAKARAPKPLFPKS
jgi:hypothetical protein